MKFKLTNKAGCFDAELGNNVEVDIGYDGVDLRISENGVVCLHIHTAEPIKLSDIRGWDARARDTAPVGNDPKRYWARDTG